MSKRRFAIPAADSLASDVDESSLTVAKHYFKKASSTHLSSEVSASSVVSVSGQPNAFPNVAVDSYVSSDRCTSSHNQPSTGAAQRNCAATTASDSGVSRTVRSASATEKPQPKAVALHNASSTATSPAEKLPETVAVDAATSSVAIGSPVHDARLRAAPTAARPGAIVVNARQRGNPLLKHVRRVPWEFGETPADYELGRAVCALYLSLKYHNLRPEYIHERLRLLGRAYDLRVLLALCDIPEPSHPLKELARVCVLADCTLIVAFTVEEAARYLETYKAYEHKPPDLIMERPPETGDLYSQAVDCLTAVKSVSRTDAGSLLNRFGTVGRIVTAPDDDLCLCSGFGPLKAKRLGRACREPFLVLPTEKGSRMAAAPEEKESSKQEQQPSE